jgi:jasmonate ZIM domain-containing protein
VLVLDDVPADKAAGLLQLVAAAVPGPGAKTEVARKASLHRFMEKRKKRAAARATPYLRPL